MSVWPLPAWIALATSALAVSAILAWTGIRYANRYRMIDRPGQRRSHKVPTPRGGGIGIAVAVVAGLSVIAAVAGDGGAFADSLPLIASVALVALVGWIDDHRGLAAGWRLTAHCIAAALLGIPAFALLLPGAAENPAMAWIVTVWLVCAIAIVGSINLHNFMDGIDGLLTLQALFVFCVLAWVCYRAGKVGEAQGIGLFAAATLGFLPFNFPRARIFLGDVGSGVLGLTIAVAVYWQMAAVPGAFWAGFIASSAFIVDSSATLISRVLSGRRWYSAHREHLYQWLVRSGFSHAQVVGMYMGWNLGVALPVIGWSQLDASATMAAGALPVRGSGAMFAVFALAVVLWVFGKRYCLRVCRGGPRSS